MMRSVIAGAFAALFVAAPASAQSLKGVLVLPLEHEGLPEATVSTLDAAIRSEVKASLPRLALLPPPALGLQDLQLAAGCVDASPKCLAGIGRTLGASRVVRVMTRGSAERVSLRVLVVRAKTARVKEHAAELVGVDDQSGPELRWHVATALGRKPKPLAGRIELYTASKVGSLPGAELLLDDSKIPAGALDSIEPGRHRVEVRQQGFETFIWLGQVRGGRTTRVAVSFEPKTAPPPPPPVAAAPPPPVETPPIADAPPPSSVEAPPAAEVVTAEPDDGPTLVLTWVFGAGAVVAATAATVLTVQTYNLDKEVTELGGCANVEPEKCDRGERLQTTQFVMWGVTGALAVAAVTAFFLEDGPDLFGGDAQAVAVGVAPTRDGVAASLQVSF